MDSRTMDSRTMDSKVDGRTMERVWVETESGRVAVRRAGGRRRRLSGLALSGLVLASVSCSAGPGSWGATPPTSDGGSSEETTTTVAGAPGGSATPVDEATAVRFQAALDDTRAALGFPGVVAGVWSPGGSWVSSSGTRGEGMDEAATAGDHTRVGSLTKTMTATVVLQLVEEGKLSLDDVIGTYVAGMPNGEVATLAQLLDMTAGIPTYTASDEFQAQLFADPERQWTPEELLAFVADTPADFAPGEGWSYSNTNYVLLGLVIEQVTGQPIADVFQERLFGPLGMVDTTFPTGTAAIAEPALHGVTGQGQPDGQTTDATGWSPSEAFTAGEVVSTLDDLKLWADALFTGEGILSPEMQQQRRDSIVFGLPPLTATSGYGYGIGDRGGWWGHTGEIPGYTTVLMHSYELDTTIIVVTNSDVVAGQGAPTPAGAVFAALVGALG